MAGMQLCLFSKGVAKLKYQTISKASKALKISRTLLYQLAREGRIEAKKESGKWYIKRQTNERVFTTSSLAYEMGWSTQYVRKMIKDGFLISIKIGGLHRIPMSEAASLMLRRLNEGG